MSFESLGLSDPLLKAIAKKGYTTPSPIQEKCIPVVLQGKDVLASAQTGTGKTAGFTLPLLQILSGAQTPQKRPIRALVLTPTRELAAQILENVREYSTFLKIKSTVVFGGVKQGPQVNTLRNGVDVLVATPGRLLDLIDQGYISLKDIEILVLDEADRMLDMGFLRDIKKVLAIVPEKRQTLLFSATFSKDIKKLANGFLTNPILVEATPENTTAEKVNQKIYHVDKVKKAHIIIKMISDGDWQQTLVFTRTKHGANKLCEKMQKAGITAAAIHGNKTQGARTKALAGFKAREIRVLVATDIAARGIDIPLLPHVVNFELPNVPEDYVHRIGRTGRAGANGIAISLVSHDEAVYLRDIEKLLKQKIPTGVIEGFEQGAAPKEDPKEKRPQNHSPRKPRNKTGGGNWGKNKNSGSGNRSNNSRRRTTNK
ncbi:MAG: DEAD/DEAH box helicase [Flavobacteriales bacterium]|tara:strand:+ start:415 stop:1701 length:1287 start_codon:yes stop_codon:yes gene_type:complete